MPSLRSSIAARIAAGRSPKGSCRAVRSPARCTGWVVDLASGRAAAPDEGCVATLAVKLVAGRILLAVPAHPKGHR